MVTESSSTRVAPGPPGLPYIGSLLDALEDPLQLFTRTQAQYGDVALLRFVKLRYFLVTDHRALHRVLVENAKNYTKSRNYDGLRLVMGDGLLTSEGDFWRRQRRLAQPAFHRERLAGFARVMQEETAAMLDRWERERLERLDLHAEMSKLTLKIVARTLFATVVGDEAAEVGEALTVALRYANDYAESIVKPPRWLPTPATLRFRRAVRTLDALVYRIIEERRRREDEGDDLLGMLMAARDDAGERMSDRQLRDEVMTLVLAGHETTANALTWTFYQLSKSPEIERRLASDIASVLGTRAATFEDVPKLRYTSMVVQESMRLHPPVWCFERQAIESDVAAGYAIPARSIIGVPTYLLHRDPNVWENPEGFDPERFTPERIEARPRMAYLPFGAGPRTCIGNAFAMMEAQLLLATIAQRATLSLAPGTRVELEPVITLRPRGGLPMTVRYRSPEVRLAPAPQSLPTGGEAAQA